MNLPIPTIQFDHLYSFTALSGSVLTVVAVQGHATVSLDRRMTANQIMRESDDSFREDRALQLKVLQADPSKAGQIPEHLNAYTGRRQAEVSAIRRERLKENTASALKVLHYYQWMLGVGLVLLASGAGLWYVRVQRQRDAILRAEARREKRNVGLLKERAKKALVKKRPKLVPAAASE